MFPLHLQEALMRHEVMEVQPEGSQDLHDGRGGGEWRGGELGMSFYQCGLWRIDSAVMQCSKAPPTNTCSARPIIIVHWAWYLNNDDRLYRPARDPLLQQIANETVVDILFFKTDY